MAATGSAMLPQLEELRKACLGDSAQYTAVVPGIVPIIQTAADLDVRRWGADFLAEAFATPTLPGPQKEQLITDTVMALLRAMLESQTEDAAVVRSAVQACSSAYPYVFRRVIAHPELALVWRDMSNIKNNILQRMDIAPTPVRVCCIKFLQKVVQVQTPGMISDPRRPEHNETSIALVPRNHPLLPLANLEAETSGILDRLLSVIQENSTDPILVDATMNCLAVLIKTRPPIQAKILTTVLNYNPLRLATGPMTPKTMVLIQSLQRTTRALLRYVHRIMPQHPMADKINAYLQRLQSSTQSVFAQARAQKRPAESNDGLDDPKRQRMAPPRKYPPMTPPPHSYAQLFTLVENAEHLHFDVKTLPEDLVTMLASALMQHIDSKSLDEAIEEVRQRYQAIKDAQAAAMASGADEDDDYDPEALSALDQSAARADEEALGPAQPVLDLGPFELPKPAPLSDIELAMLSQQTIAHVFETALTAEPGGAASRAKLGINRLAGSTNDKDSWLTLMIRLATRAPTGLDKVIDDDVNGDVEIKDEEATATTHQGANVPNRIRRLLFDYVLDDWRHRLSLGITWLTEEWYADKVQIASSSDTPMTNGLSTKFATATPNYDYWVAQLFETLIPRFDENDRNNLIRFVSELPSINQNILSQLQRLARDPATFDICLKALHYLYMMRPPVRESVIDTMETIWQDGDGEAKTKAGDFMTKWRPGFVERAVEETRREVEDTRIFPNGVKEEDMRRSTSAMSGTAASG